jgi:hypothetical protein
MRRNSVVFGVACADGMKVAWSRDDPADVYGQGTFSGTPELVTAIRAVLARREPLELPTHVVWHFPKDPQLRPADVAAAMIEVAAVDGNVSGLLEQFPELGGPPPDES